MKLSVSLKLILVALPFLAIALCFQNCSPAASGGGSGGGTTVATANACSPGGTPLNIGSTNGGNFCQSLDATGNAICFDNQTLNFSGSGTAPGSSVTLLILADVGPTCSLGITWPGGGVATVGQVEGDGYIGQFPDGSIVQFIAGHYDGAKVAISYKYSPNLKGNTVNIAGEGSDSCYGCGQGSGTIVSSPSGINVNVVSGSASGTLSAVFPAGTVVTLTATPASGTTGCLTGHSNMFGAWIGSMFSGGNTSSATVNVATSSSGNAAYNLTANFGCQ